MYNQKRLTELPIPKTRTRNDQSSDDSDDSFGDESDGTDGDDDFGNFRDNFVDETIENVVVPENNDQNTSVGSIIDGENVDPLASDSPNRNVSSKSSAVDNTKKSDCDVVNENIARAPKSTDANNGDAQQEDLLASKKARTDGTDSLTINANSLVNAPSGASSSIGSNSNAPAVQVNESNGNFSGGAADVSASSVDILGASAVVPINKSNGNSTGEPGNVSAVVPVNTSNSNVTGETVNDPASSLFDSTLDAPAILSDNPMDDNHNADPVKEEPVPLVAVCSTNQIELEDLLDSDEEVIDEYDDDVTIVFNKKTGYAKPFASNADGLIKHENDSVSGNLPFAEKVSKIKSSKIKSFRWNIFQNYFILLNTFIERRPNLHVGKKTSTYSEERDRHIKRLEL